MKKKHIIILISIVIVLFSGAVYVASVGEDGTKKVTTGDEAVLLLQNTYPKYREYPSDNLPSKNIEILDVPDGWRVGMYIQGSGVPGILRADCFFVTKSGVINKTGLFQGEGPARTVDLATCTPKE